MNGGGYNSDLSTTNFINNEQLYEIVPAQINTIVYHTPNRNTYATVNGNLVLTKDIRLKLTTGTGLLKANVINFPKPLNSSIGALTGTLTSFEGQTFFYAINNDGIIFLEGEFLTTTDELLMNPKPYIAKWPIEYGAPFNSE